MKALWVSDSLGWASLEEPPLEEGQVRIRVLVSALTGLDREVARGLAPFRGVPGAAFVGIVEETAGSAAQHLLGRRVVGRGLFGCGECEACRSGGAIRCHERRRPGVLASAGAHAETLALPASAVIPVPPAVRDEVAALAPLLATFYAALMRVDMPTWTNMLVVGDGGTGLLAALAYGAAGYTVTVRGKHGDRFDLLRRHGVHFNFVSDPEEIAGVRRGRFGPTLAHYPVVVEATGSLSGWSAATRLVSSGGVLFLLSSCFDGDARPLAAVQAKNVRVIGMREGPLEPVLTILERNYFDPTVVVTRVVPFADTLDAYRRSDDDREWILLLDHRS